MPRTTKHDQLTELLDKVSHEELKQFIFDSCEKDHFLRESFLLKFVLYSGEGNSATQYRNQIKSILQSIKDRYGFVNRYVACSVGMEVDGLLETAEQQINENKLEDAFVICTVVLEEMTVALDFCDDSDAGIGSCIDYAEAVLQKIIGCKLPESLRKTIFNYCKNTFSKGVFAGWGWHLGMLELAAKVAKTDNEFDALIVLLDSEKSESEYENRQSQLIRYQLLNKIKGLEAANTYLMDNISAPEFRKMAIESAIADNRFAEAERLAKDGIEADKERYPGLVRDWYDYLLVVAQTKNDKAKIIEYARHLFFGSTHWAKQDYYQILKTHIAAKDWADYVNAIVADIQADGRYSYESILYDIFIKEAWWSRLFDLVKQSQSLEIIGHYEKYLAADYASELADLYIFEINKFLKDYISRKYYQKACHYIKRINKLGETDKATALIEQLKEQYPKRKALVEELEKLES